jgi:hypothetical protein
MARNVTRESFRPASPKMEIATDLYPDRVSIDLDDKDANNFTVVEVDDRDPDDPQASRTQDPSTWGDANAQDPQGASPRVEKRIGRLKAETETQRRLRENAEKERDAALELARAREAEIMDLRRRSEATGTALAASMKSTAEAKINDAKERYARAHADGDSAALATAADDLSRANAELVQVVARTPAARPAEERQPAAPARQPSVTDGMHPNAREWVSRNPAFTTDPAFRSRAMAAHYAAEAEGIRPDSPDYGATLDKHLKTGYANREPDSGSQGEGRSTPRRTNAVTDGGREPLNGGQRNPRIVELSSSQLAVAKQLGITPQQYAASMLKLNCTGA